MLQDNKEQVAAAHLVELLLQQLQELLCRATIQQQRLRHARARTWPPEWRRLLLLLQQQSGRVLQVLVRGVHMLLIVLMLLLQERGRRLRD